MSFKRLFFGIITGILFSNGSSAQIVINEGTNRNYMTMPDEDAEYPDWIELYNAGTDTV